MPVQESQRGREARSNARSLPSVRAVMAFRRRTPHANRNAFPSYASHSQAQGVPIPPSTLMLLRRLGAATVLILIFLFAFGENLGTPAGFLLGSDAIEPTNEPKPATTGLANTSETNNAVQASQFAPQELGFAQQNWLLVGGSLLLIGLVIGFLLGKYL